VLDLGCGTGALLSSLDVRSISGVGVDRSPSMLGAARRRDKALRLVRAEAVALPFGPGTFGSCVVTYPAPFILQPAVLDEVARVLTPRGRLIVMFGFSSEAHDEATRKPKALLLRVFYGSEERVVRAPELEHPAFDGAMSQVSVAGSTALIWIGRRRSMGGGGQDTSR
jgi:ubiquinone/menaquinone biosynthesis C-methylase UbiE